MPSVSERQAHFMAAVAHGWHPAGVRVPPRSVAEDFHNADKREGKWEHTLHHKYHGKQSTDHANGYG